MPTQNNVVLHMQDKFENEKGLTAYITNYCSVKIKPITLKNTVNIVNSGHIYILAYAQIPNLRFLRHHPQCINRI